MRNFCRHTIDQYKVEAQHVKIVSFIISGPYISAEVMTFKGCVGVLYSSPRLKMPENIAEIPRLLPPVLALVYKCSIVMKETMQFLVDTAIPILNNLFLADNDILDRDLDRPDWKCKVSGIACLENGRITPVLVEFLGGINFNSTDKKETSDELKIDTKLPIASV